ncbi:MAG: hypothetical protein N2260_10305 [Syntrophobacterales bacterium]|nr:hypothetical protein [Syntrophobacterales bacterium]
MRKSLILISLIAAGLIFASISHAGNGRGAMDGTGPISITSGCLGKAGITQPGLGKQLSWGRKTGMNFQGQGFGRR